MPTPTRPRLLLGAPVAEALLASARAGAADLADRTGTRPCLATVLVGDDPASATYVAMKRRRCAANGLESRLVHLPATTTTAGAVHAVATLSADPSVHGILVQHPAPDHVDERAVFEAIAPAKDVDGCTAAAMGRMALGLPGAAACTPAGILALLDHHGIEVAGRHAVVLGRSPILGRPVAALLLDRDATVTVCHSRTTDLPDVVRAADLVVAAVGIPRFVRGDWLAPGAVVVDAGYHPGGVGDVATDEAELRASAITPVPGGVGPTTIAVLLTQTVGAARTQLVG